MAVADPTKPTPQTSATKTTDFAGFIKPEMSGPLFDQAAKSSIVMRLARRIPLSPNGVDVPFTTSKPVAAWVAEGAEKPTTEGGLSLKHIKVAKMACTSVMSQEVVRANPGGYVDLLRPWIAEAFALTFDAAALHGTNTPFGVNNFVDATTKKVALGTATSATGSVYGDVVAGLDVLVKAGKKLTGFAFDREVEPLFLGSLDTAGRPLFIDAPTASDTVDVVTGGRLIGRPAVLGDTIAHTPTGVGAKKVLGYGGDWSQCVYGMVGGITYKVSTEATVNIGGTLTSAFQHNLVVLLAEAEFGFYCNDPESFVQYTSK